MSVSWQRVAFKWIFASPRVRRGACDQLASPVVSAVLYLLLALHNLSYEANALAITANGCSGWPNPCVHNGLPKEEAPFGAFIRVGVFAHIANMIAHGAVSYCCCSPRWRSFAREGETCFKGDIFFVGKFCREVLSGPTVARRECKPAPVAEWLEVWLTLSED